LDEDSRRQRRASNEEINQGKEINPGSSFNDAAFFKSFYVDKWYHSRLREKKMYSVSKF
jgi:hypothetical protein